MSQNPSTYTYVDSDSKVGGVLKGSKSKSIIVIVQKQDVKVGGVGMIIRGLWD